MNDSTHDRTVPTDANGDLGYLLTAYADGQLALEGMAWVEEQLDQRPELRARLKEIRALQAALREQFARFPAPAELGEFARGQVLAAARRGQPVIRRRWAQAALVMLGMSATVMAVMATLGQRAGESASMRVTNLDIRNEGQRDGRPSPVAAPASASAPTAGPLSYNFDKAQQEVNAVTEDTVAERGNDTDDPARGREEAVSASEGRSVAGAFAARRAESRAAPSHGFDRPTSANEPGGTGSRLMRSGEQLARDEAREKEVQRQREPLRKDDERSAGKPAEPQVQPPSLRVGRADGLAANTPAAVASAPPAALAIASPTTPALPEGSRAASGHRRAAASAAPPAPVPALIVIPDALAVAGGKGPMRGEAPSPPQPPQVATGLVAGLPAAPSEGMAPTSNMNPFGAPYQQGSTIMTSVPLIVGDSLTPQAGGLAYDASGRAPSDFNGFLLDKRNAPGQQAQVDAAAGVGGYRTLNGQTASKSANVEKTNLAQVDRAVGFQLNGKLAEVEDDLNNASVQLARRDGDLDKLIKEGGEKVAALGINKDRDLQPQQGLGGQRQSASFEQAVVAAVRLNPQGQQDLVMITAGKGSQIEPGSEFMVFRGSTYVVKVRAVKVLNDMVACRVIPESWNTQQQAIQNGDLAQALDSRAVDEVAGTQPTSGLLSERLSFGNAKRPQRDRLAALTAPTTIAATAPLATLLRTAAGPDGALAASPALEEVLTLPAHLDAKDLPSGQALLEIARGAGLQARVVDGVFTLDTTRGPLDPTDTQGLDRATFTKAFGTVPMVATADDARSTFALDANTASFERARAQLRAGQAPDPAAIQAEHFINAMPMDYPAASGPEAFTLYAEAAPAPFARSAGAELVRAPWAARTAVVAVGAVARPAGPDERRPLHLTLALDCSGSMAQPGGLDRIRTGLAELLRHLGPTDTVAVVAFSDQARVVLPATSASEPATIAAAITGLVPGGATNAAEGLALAYQLAAEKLEPGTENRVLFATDGGTLAGADAAGVSERVAAYRSRGISLLVVGCGAGPYQGRTLQQLADRADGQHVFLGSDDEARSAFAGRLLPERLGLLAKDAKVQVTWNPQRVSHFRLIGYEQRRLAHQDFRNDAVDAGEISHDTQVTALYEVLLVDGATGPLGSAAVRYYDTRLQQVRELSCPLAGAVLQAEPSARLRLIACAAEFAAWLQRGWWSNVRPTTPARLLGELQRCPQAQARELEELVRRAAALQPQPMPLNGNVTPAGNLNGFAPAAPTDQSTPRP